jgi:stringent starvation protein B
MLSNRPYLLRAFYEWIIDSKATPILVIDAHHPHCKIPIDYVEGGEIIFNISPAAVRDFEITNECVEFKASFSGIVHIISVPVKAILAIYAEENGEGIFFDAEEDDGGEAGEIVQLKNGQELSLDGAAEKNTQTPLKKNKPVLKLVE